MTKHKKIPLIGPDSGTAEWLAARPNSIGASEMAAAAGLSPYTTPLELYARKRSEIPDVEDNDAMRMGRLLEPIVKSEFIRTSGLRLLKPNPPMYIHPEYRQITATPDGIIDDSTLLECKTASWRMKGEWGSEGSDDVPTLHLVQCQAQLCVLQADLVHLAVLFDGFTLKTFQVLRNDELITLLLSAALELWERIQNGDPPEPNFEHASTPKLIRVLHKEKNLIDKRIMLTEESAIRWADYERLGKQEKEIKNSRTVLKAHIESEIGDYFAGVLPDGRMIRRKWMVPEPYVVEKKPSWDVRCVKFDGGEIANLNLTEGETE